MSTSIICIFSIRNGCVTDLFFCEGGIFCSLKYELLKPFTNEYLLYFRCLYFNNHCELSGPSPSRTQEPIFYQDSE